MTDLAAGEATLQEFAGVIEHSPDKVVVVTPSSSTRPELLSRAIMKCWPPVLAGIGENLRAASKCIGGYGGASVMLWESDRNRFSRGVLLTLQRSAWGGGLEPTQGWRELSYRYPWLDSLARAQRENLGTLSEFWERMREQARKGFPVSMSKTPELWPTDLQAIHRDGRIMVKGGKLVGIDSWKKWIKQQAWPDDVQGIAGVEVLTPEGFTHVQPGWLVDMVEVGNASYGAVLIENKDMRAQFTLWSGKRSQLVLIPLRRLN